MTSSYLVTVPKTDLKLRKVADFTTGIFIDNSGSTCSQLVSIGKTVLQAELSICQATQFNHTILWNTSARICSQVKSVKSEGGTEPTAIFQNDSTKKAFTTSDVIVFVTDGEINDSSVTKFATYTKDNLNKALVICVIVHKRLASPSQINISVVAPLMMASNVLCLFYDGETFYVLASKGYISQFYQASNDLSDYQKLTTLNLKELFHNMQIYEHQQIPDGCIPIRDNAKEIIAVDLQQLLSTTDFHFVSQLTENYWKTLIQHGKIENKLDQFRTFVAQMKNQSIQFDKNLCQSNFDFKYSTQRDEIIAQIVTLKLNGTNEQTSELNQLRHQLHQISDQAKIEEIEYLKYINDNLHKTRQYWNNIQSLIHEQETGSYSINDFTFASNRANRAKVLTTNDEEYSETIKILDHSNVPLFECAICMEQGPFVLWLKQPTDLNETTNDFIINFPLEGNDKLLCCIVANPVCGSCAQSYVNSTIKNANQLITLYREPCAGFIPLNWSIASNQKFAKYTLFQILTGNKILHHISMLLLAMIDDYKSNWFSSEVKDYFIHQIIDNIYTTDSFSDEGNRMLFRQTLKEIIKQEDKLFRQPMKAVCRILNFNAHFHQLDKEVIQILLRKRFALMCIEHQCSRTKFGPEYLVIVKQQVSEIIFDTLCGIPLVGSLKKIEIINDHFREFLNPIYEYFIHSIDKLAASIGTDHSSLFPSEMISFVLYLLTTIPLHDRPMKIYTEFALKHRTFRSDMQVHWTEFEQNVHTHVFGNYHPLAITPVPSYAINLGRFSCPSKLFFNTQPLWKHNLENQRIHITTLMNQLKTNLDNKLFGLYGSVVPNTSSGHFLLHIIVAEILENRYANDDIMTEEMIMNCMIRFGQTQGRKGNIYAEYVFPAVVVTIEDYLKFRRTTTNRIQLDNEQLSRSYQYKIISELVASGMDYDPLTNEVMFEPLKLKVPHMLDIRNKDIDFVRLREHVQELYIASRKISTNDIDQTCLNIEIKDFIEFGYKMDANDLLPVWTKEQENIVHSIITDTDQIEQPIKYIAGLDISFDKTNDKAVASMVIFDYETLKPVAKISVPCHMKIPYIANYLAFREAPVFMKLIDIQKEHCPHLTPQVILMDGNGVWHPRRAGIAAHFGVLSGIPCFGVSKNVLYADGITREKIEELLTEKAPKEDQYIEVIGDSGAVLGLAYNVTGFVKNAVYISVGHKITLTTACDIFKSVVKYRICEPIRQADLLSREMVAKLT